MRPCAGAAIHRQSKVILRLGLRGEVWTCLDAMVAPWFTAPQNIWSLRRLGDSFGMTRNCRPRSGCRGLWCSFVVALGYRLYSFLHQRKACLRRYFRFQMQSVLGGSAKVEKRYKNGTKKSPSFQIDFWFCPGSVQGDSWPS